MKWAIHKLQRFTCSISLQYDSCSRFHIVFIGGMCNEQLDQHGSFCHFEWTVNFIQSGVKIGKSRHVLASDSHRWADETDTFDGLISFLITHKFLDKITLNSDAHCSSWDIHIHK